MGSSEPKYVILVHGSDSEGPSDIPSSSAANHMTPASNQSKSLAEKIEALRANPDLDPDMLAYFTEMLVKKYAEFPPAEVPPQNYADGSEDEALVFRGPNEKDFTPDRHFDKYYMFGNNMFLTKNQLDFLDDYTDGCNVHRSIKLYVHRMTYSNTVEYKCKMEFGATFNKKYLKSYPPGVESVRTILNINHTFDIRTKMGKLSNRAMMTGEWKLAAKKYKLKEDCIVIFNFKPKPSGGLSLRLQKLPVD